MSKEATQDGYEITCPHCGRTLVRKTRIPTKRCYCGALLFFEEKKAKKEDARGN